MGVLTKNKYQKLGRVSSLMDLTASPNEIEAGPPKSIHPTIGEAYLIILVNETNYCYENIRLRLSGNQWPDKWQPCPSVCNNCAPGNEENCEKSPERLTAVLQVSCGGASFDIQIATKFDASGKAHGATFSGLTADCAYGGGFVVIT